jgi:hypothetical protein
MNLRTAERIASLTPATWAEAQRQARELRAEAPRALYEDEDGNLRQAPVRGVYATDAQRAVRRAGVITLAKAYVEFYQKHPEFARGNR